eukprot:431515-Prymnesium_polylepis.1
MSKTAATPNSALAALGVSPEKLEGLDAEAQWQVVRKRYLRLAVRLHPDHGGDPDSFCELHAAFEALSR